MVKKAKPLEDPRKWVETLDLEDTSDIAVPKQMVDQVIGQEPAVDIIRKAAEQRRHVMLIGDPGTGKSMLGNAMADLLPPEELQDVLIYHNPETRWRECWHSMRALIETPPSKMVSGFSSSSHALPPPVSSVNVDWKFSLTCL